MVLSKQLKISEIQEHFKKPEVEAVFNNYQNGFKEKLLQLRQLIFKVAAEIDGLGEIEETLKWGQPSYLTAQSKSGSTIRIDSIKPETEEYAIYFNCKTTLVSTFKAMYPDKFNFRGNRSIIFKKESDLPIEALYDCISLALTYHLDKLY